MAVKYKEPPRLIPNSNAYIQEYEVHQLFQKKEKILVDVSSTAEYTQVPSIQMTIVVD